MANFSTEKIKEIRILDNQDGLFTPKDKYVIPLYQRAFAWEEKQLTQLVEDILGTVNENYYIGSLIVARQSDFFEVIDGQQRLTSLFLLLSCLDCKPTASLSFAYRKKSNYTLNKIQSIHNDERDEFNAEDVEASIKQGLDIIEDLLRKDSCDKNILKQKLKNVIIYRIEVPQHTDLNRYFEIMNTRGEQLEQHDILKATLMGFFPDNKNSTEKDRQIFSKIWDACSDMTGYIQMNFDVKSRETIFSYYWNEKPSNKWSDYKTLNIAYNNKPFSINEIIKNNITVSNNTIVDKDDSKIRFESVIDFPYFLLHCLKVYVSIKGCEHLMDDLLDDKKLVSSFEKVWKNLSIDKDKFSKEFLLLMLQLRFLFDKYIIKREFIGDNKDGEWSLKELCVSTSGRSKKPYFKNTIFKRDNEWEKTYKERTKNNLMLESALRVSYTSPKIMHWITDILTYLAKKKDNDFSGFTEEIENIAKVAVREDFFAVCEDDEYLMGLNTPHIVFNYLDYLLWKENKQKFDDFVFEYRNSVEHWYPQNPSEGTFDAWTDGCDTFGNLCIIQRNVNSKFSNLAPEAKKTTFNDMIKKGSLKLRLMSELTKSKGGKISSYCWKDSECFKHEEEMIEILKDACEI